MSLNDENYICHDFKNISKQEQRVLKASLYNVMIIIITNILSLSIYKWKPTQTKIWRQKKQWNFLIKGKSYKKSHNFLSP